MSRYLFTRVSRLSLTHHICQKISPAQLKDTDSVYLSAASRNCFSEYMTNRTGHWSKEAEGDGSEM